MTDLEYRSFAKRFILDHLAFKGETVDEYFCHWLPYKYPEVSRDTVKLAVRDLIRQSSVSVTRTERLYTGDIQFLAIA
jgi:hypothetical protein